MCWHAHQMLLERRWAPMYDPKRDDGDASHTVWFLLYVQLRSAGFAARVSVTIYFYIMQISGSYVTKTLYWSLRCRVELPSFYTSDIGSDLGLILLLNGSRNDYFYPLYNFVGFIVSIKSYYTMVSRTEVREFHLWVMFNFLNSNSIRKHASLLRSFLLFD